MLAIGFIGVAGPASAEIPLTPVADNTATGSASIDNGSSATGSASKEYGTSPTGSQAGSGALENAFCYPNGSVTCQGQTGNGHP
ncbi:hypothetical protein [Nocardia sp. NPDC004123]